MAPHRLKAHGLIEDELAHLERGLAHLEREVEVAAEDPEDHPAQHRRGEVGVGLPAHLAKRLPRGDAGEEPRHAFEAGQRGIEIGHVFYLGTKYSKAMNASFLDENGKPQLMEMGCYGIGVTRILGAAIEQCHDDRGIIWPASIAPFAAVICPIGYDRSAEVRAAADQLHDALQALGVDVMLDDRGERPGAMFADWELIGAPQRVVISDRGLKAGTVELQGRREAAATVVPLADVAGLVKERLAA